MLKLAAFADEISPDLDVQIKHMKSNGIAYFELRGVAGKNVLDFDSVLRKEIRTKLADNGLAVACIGSPIGKVKLSDPFEPHFERYKIAVELAEYFDAPLIRVFSYYETGTGRAEVMRRLQMQADYLKGRRPVLVHENEKDIYGEKAAQCLDIHQTIQSAKLKAAFDFANFVQVGENPLDNWRLLNPHVVHIHVKDALKANGHVVPAGQGDGHVAAILKDAYHSGYRGFLSLEPHLSAAGQFSGFSGPDLFKTAVDALKKILREAEIPFS